MDYVIKIMTPAERNYCYTDSPQIDKLTGCIGHLRGDMDKSGNGFFTSWWDHAGTAQTEKEALRCKLWCICSEVYSGT